MHFAAAQTPLEVRMGIFLHLNVEKKEKRTRQRKNELKQQLTSAFYQNESSGSSALAIAFPRRILSFLNDGEK